MVKMIDGGGYFEGSYDQSLMTGSLIHVSSQIPEGHHKY